MRRPQLTIRALLVLVAVVAVLLIATRMVMSLGELSRAYRQQAAVHAQGWSSRRRAAGFWDSQVAQARQGADMAQLLRRAELGFEPELSALRWIEAAKESRESAEYHARMRRKWNDAADHPWLPVEPDPPPHRPRLTPEAVQRLMRRSSHPGSPVRRPLPRP